MHKQSVKITTLVIIFSILSVYLQFFCYYFFDSFFVTLGVSFLLSLLLSHFSLETSLSYEPGSIQTLFTVLPDFIFVVLIYLNRTGGFFTYHRYLPLLLLVNWLVPLLYFSLRFLCDPGPRFVDYRRYFIKTSVIFAAFYLLILADKLFLRPLMPPCRNVELKSFSLIPFWTTAAHIEGCIYERETLPPLLIYLVKNVLLYLPFGFYLRLAGKGLGFLGRSVLLVLVPLLAEAVQFLLNRGRLDIDDFFFALLGGLLGILLYHIIDPIFRSATGHPFLEERETYSFLRSFH